MTPQTRAYLTLICGVVGFAFSPILVTLADVSGLTATLYRTGVGAMVMLVPFGMERGRDVGRNRPNFLTILKVASIGGVLFALNNGLFNTAVTLIPAANAIFLANTAVIWVGLISIIVYKERLGVRFWLGIPLALIGVLLITTDGSLTTQTNWSGNVIALVGGFFYALNILYNNIARRVLSAITYMTLFNVTAAMLLFIVILLIGVPYRGFDGATYGYLVALGFIAQGIGFLAVVQSQAVLPASRVSTVLLAQPLLVLVLAFVILGERPTPIQLIGIGVLFVGIVLANRRKGWTRRAA